MLDIAADKFRFRHLDLTMCLIDAATKARLAYRHLLDEPVQTT